MNKHFRLTGKTTHNEPFHNESSILVSVFKVIRQFGPISRAELSRKTGISAPAISKHVQTLLDNNLVYEVGFGPSDGGRKPILLQFNARYGYVIAIDLSTHEIKYAIADLDGEIIEKLATPSNPYQYPSSTIDQITNTIYSLLQDAKITGDLLLCITIALPGIVDMENGVVLYARNLIGWQNFPLKSIMEKEFGIPVCVGNDLNLAALGEYWRGATRGIKNSALIGLCGGIGSGFIVNGQLHLGHHMLAGEIGLMAVSTESLKMNYGDRGCLESIAGSAAIVQRMIEAIRKGGNSSIVNLYATDNSHITPEMIIRAALDGDQLANEIVDELIPYLAFAILNVIVVLDPEVIVLTGDLVAGGEQLLERINKQLVHHLPANTQMVYSQLGDEATLIGVIGTSVELANEGLLNNLKLI